MAKVMKRQRQKIDWDNIKIRIVPADMKNPNPLNPCSYLSGEERERQIVSICGKIWARVMREQCQSKQD